MLPPNASAPAPRPTGLRVLFNNREIANFANPDLALRILIGFIGDKPPSEDLKRHLLGATE